MTQKIQRVILDLAVECYGQDIIADTLSDSEMESCAIYLNSDSYVPLLSITDPHAFDLTVCMLRQKKKLLKGEI